MRELAYFQKNCKEAFHEGFTAKLRNEVLGGEVYNVYQYFIPCHLVKKVKWLKRYFKFQDNQDIPIDSKRRGHFCEFAETAMMILNRIHLMTSKGNSIIAGSEYVCALPWAVFGDADRMSQHQFKNIKEVSRYYHNVLHGPCRPIEVHFQCCWTLPTKIANQFSEKPLCSPNLWMSVALALAYDIIHNCGPDTHEFFELFCNDYREGPETIDIKAWQALRCKILGITPPPEFFEKLPYCRIPPEAYKNRPRRSRKMKTEIAEISSCQDLSLGEKTKPLFLEYDDSNVFMSSIGDAPIIDAYIPITADDAIPAFDIGHKDDYRYLGLYPNMNTF